MTRVATVTIDTPNGSVVMNKSDYDPDKHTLHVVKLDLTRGDVEIDLEPVPSEQTATWLKLKLVAKDVNFAKGMNKADLLKLYEMAYG